MQFNNTSRKKENTTTPSRTQNAVSTCTLAAVRDRPSFPFPFPFPLKFPAANDRVWVDVTDQQRIEAGNMVGSALHVLSAVVYMHH